MQRDRERVRVVDERALGAVAVVDVPVDDGDPADAELVAGLHHRQREVGEQAVAAAPVALRVVARRTHQRVGVVDLAGDDRAHRGRRTAGREQGDLPRARAEPGVLPGVAALGAGHGHQRVEVVRGVEAQRVLARQRLAARARRARAISPVSLTRSRMRRLPGRRLERRARRHPRPEALVGAVLEVAVVAHEPGPPGRRCHHLALPSPTPHTLADGKPALTMVNLGRWSVGSRSSPRRRSCSRREASTASRSGTSARPAGSAARRSTGTSSRRTRCSPRCSSRSARSCSTVGRGRGSATPPPRWTRWPRWCAGTSTSPCTTRRSSSCRTATGPPSPTTARERVRSLQREYVELWVASLRRGAPGARRGPRAGRWRTPRSA